MVDYLAIGAASNLVAHIAVHPIDNLCSYLAATRVTKISLFRGLIPQLSPAALRGAVISGGYGYVHEYCRTYKNKIPFWCAHLAASTTAATGFVASNYFYERALWQLQKIKNTSLVVNANPIPRIQWSQIPIVILFLTSYGGIRHSTIGDNGNQLQYFTIGGLSGLVATGLNYPLGRYHYCRTNSMVWEVMHDARYCLKYMWNNKLFYTGASMQFYTAFWRSGILFTMLEMMLKWRDEKSAI